jgi:sugar phosphate isomerase/epimerase
MNYSLNSWSFERYLGPFRLLEWDEKQQRHVYHTENMPEETTLLGLLVRMGSNAYHSLELAYGHLRSHDDQTLRDIRHVAEVSKVDLSSLLLDFGDLSGMNSLRRSADLEMYRNWIQYASQAGFMRVRIPAGDSPPDDRDALIRASEGLSELAVFGAERGVRIVTENLGGLLSTADNCLKLFDLCQGKVGFTADFGNFDRDKYAQLKEVLPYAETVHAKARLDAAGRIDEVDFKKCLEICREAEFSGPFSLTYEGEEDPWEKMNIMRTLSEALPTMSSPLDALK